MNTESLIARLKVQGQAAFGTALRGAAAQVRGLGRQAQETSTSTEKLSKSSRGAGTSMAWMATIARRSTFAFAAALGGVAYAGIQFNSSMEQNTVAFKHFLGSTKVATAYLDDLYHLAATTPFEFGPLVTADKRMLAFGFSAKGALSTLRVIGDAVSGLGSGQEGIDRMVIAFGQIKSSGFLRGQDLLQLQQAGIATTKYLKAAGLATSKDVGNIGNLHISATKGIAAIIAGMRKDFGGLSREQSKTWAGQLSTLRDNARQLAGYATKPLFDMLETGLLPAINGAVGRLQTYARSGGFKTLQYAFTQGIKGKPDALGSAIGGAEGMALKVGHALRMAGLEVGHFLDAFAPAAPFLNNVVVPALKLGAVVGGVTLVGALKMLTLNIRLVSTALGFVGTLFTGFPQWLGGFTNALAHPTSAIQGFGQAVSSVVSWIAARIRDLISFLDRAAHKIGNTFSKITGPLKAVSGPIGLGLRGAGFLGGLIGAKAGGGATGRSGAYLVGERGPEIVNLKSGDNVTSNARLRSMPRRRGGGSLLSIEIPVTIGTRQIDRVMAQITLDGMAAA